MKYVFCLLVLFGLIFFQFGCCEKKVEVKKKPVKFTKTVKVNDKASYEIYVPETIDISRNYPLVFFLSPTGNPKIYSKAMIEVCKSENCIYASSYNFKNNTSHNDFLPAIKDSIKHILANYPVHEKLIYLAGFSGGGQGAYVISHFMKDKFAGIIVNNGVIHPNINNSESLKYLGIKKVAIIVGNEDKVVTPADLRNDSALLQRSGISVKMFNFNGGHQVAPNDIYLKAVQWILK